MDPPKPTPHMRLPNLDATRPFILVNIPQPEHTDLGAWEPGWPTKAMAIATIVSTAISAAQPDFIPITEVIGATTLVIWLMEAVNDQRA